MKPLLSRFAFAWALAALVCCSSDLPAQGTSFSYQGQLSDGADPAEGPHDFRFTLHDLSVGGAVVAGPLTNSAVNVSRGLFTVALDFGAVFNGASRFLEIGVRPGGSTSDFTLLSPRQAVSPVPYAMHALTAGSVPNGAITAARLAAGAAAANLLSGGQSAVGGGGVVLSEQFNATELLNAGYIKMGRANLIDETWLEGVPGPADLPIPLARRGHSAVWTGSEMLIWGGLDADGNFLNTGGRYNPAAGTWTLMNPTNAPSARVGHRAVWTGSEMIVWGGRTVRPILGGIIVTDTGARYNPLTDTWTPITPGGGVRELHTAFWTGSEMLVWGGMAFGGGGIFGSSYFPLDTGARYNPAGNSWTSVSATGAPTAREDYSAVFTGTAMIIWGGRDEIGTFSVNHTNFNNGARYNVAANTWTAVSLAGAPFRRYGHSAVWSGTEMIVWGGAYQEGSAFALVRSNYNNGARYNPALNTWSPIAAAGAPSARLGHDAVWTGNRMVLWGGGDGTNAPFDSGARYFPAANTWSNVTSIGRPAARTEHTTLWTGTEMIVWGGVNDFLRDLGGRYHPVDDTWSPTSPSGERRQRRGHTAVWTGREVIIWGGTDGERHLSTGGRYIPASNLWVAIPTNGAPVGRVNHSAVWTGTEMIVWGGDNGGFLNTGGRFNPATGLWTDVATSGAPSARNGHAAVWTGSQMVVWGGLDGAFVNTGARYNPANNRWTATASANAPAARSGGAAVWTGAEMLLWGGVGGSPGSPAALSTGGRYNPAANTWAELPTPNAPGPRTAHRAVWSGDEMLVWGGTDLTSELNTGGRYNRAANTWSAIAPHNAPSPRVDHTAVWDGTRMIVWGGSTGGAALADGGIYNPLTDGWLTTATSTNTAPARALHAAVWTGSEMVVHGGYGVGLQGTLHRDDTWHYTPPRTMFLYLKP